MMEISWKRRGRNAGREGEKKTSSGGKPTVSANIQGVRKYARPV